MTPRSPGEIDDKVNGFLDRPLEGDWPYLWLDATYVKVRQTGRIVSVAVTVAVAVNDQGRREVLGVAIGASEAETFWTEFLRSLARRGLRGVKLVISDDHKGLKAAATRILGATWQRCRVHFARNLLAHAGRQGRRVVSAFPGGGDRDLGVGIVGAGDVDDIDVGVAHHFAPVGGPATAADSPRAGLGKFRRRVGDDFQDRHRQLGPEVKWHRPDRRGMCPPHPADPDESNADLVHDPGL